MGCSRLLLAAAVPAAALLSCCGSRAPGDTDAATDGDIYDGDAAADLSEEEALDVTTDDPPTEQSTWVMRIEYPMRAYGYALAELADGFMAIAGFAEGETSYAWVGKLDVTGSHAWLRRTDGSSWIWLQDLVEGPDGSIYALGVVEGIGAGGSDALILVLDADGEPTRQSTIGTEGDDRIVSAAALSGGGMLVAGIAEEATLVGHLWVARLGADLAVQWAESFDDVTADYRSVSVAEAPSGILVASASESAPYAWVALLDPDGAVVWQRTVEGQVGFTGGVDVDSTSAGDAILAFTGLDWIDVARFDPDGNPAWRKSLGGNWVRDVDVSDGGGILLSGFEDNFGTGDPNMWMLGLYGDGTIAWQKAIQRDRIETGYTITTTRDGGILSLAGGCCGTTLVKLASDGSFGHECSILFDTTAMAGAVSGGVATGTAVARSESFVVADHPIPVLVDLAADAVFECGG